MTQFLCPCRQWKHDTPVWVCAILNQKLDDTTTTSTDSDVRSRHPICINVIQIGAGPQ
ncbi:hypothetical protein CGRA01v4_09859 [Colletotrichum graminicola]|nr:hypothetical protein CGRA01v4_09859 [Colletotrichum graminicola]